MGKASQPAAPDYTAAANATAAGNLDNARLTAKSNRVDYQTPYGNLNYSQDPNDQDRWTANVSLSPSEQNLLDQQSKTSAGLGNLQDAATQRVGSSLGAPMPGAYDPTQATNNATELINARLLPAQERARAAQETQLANQGLARGSEAFTNAQTDLGQQENDARQQAALQGINLGMQQQGQTYQQAFANRNSPINELSAIRTGSQVTNPTFGNSAQQQYTGGPDQSSAVNNQYNAAVSGVNAKNANSSGLFSGLATAAATAAMMY